MQRKVLYHSLSHKNHLLFNKDSRDNTSETNYLLRELVDPKIVIKIYNISILHKNMCVLKYSILNSFAQNPAISTFFRKVHSDEREFAG